MNYFTMIKIIVLICLTPLTFGCASGAGINRRQFFDNSAFTSLPFRVSIDNSINGIEASSPAIRKEHISGATAMFGVGGALGASQGYTDAIRGRFQVSKAIKESISSLGVQNDSKYLIHFHLNKYQYRIIPKTFQIEMDINSRLDGEDDISRSLYTCDFMRSLVMFTPGVEKDMQKEIVEVIISHWGKQFNSSRGEDAKISMETIKLPSPTKGEFIGNRAKCVYEVFGAQ